MKNPSDPKTPEEELREKVLGMGARSFRKSYYPALRKKMEELERYRALLDQASNAICLLEIPSLQLVNCNKSARELFDVDRIPERSFLEVIDRQASGALTEWLDSSAGRLSGHFRLETQIRTTEERSLTIEISLTPVEFAGNAYLVCVVHDITERQKIDQMKDEMLSAVSHEMRTPLTAMLGFAEFMLNNEVDIEKQREYIGVIFKEGNRLKGLIDNLLSLQRLRAGFGRSNFQAVSILPLLIGVARLSERVSEKHKIVIDCPSDLPPLPGNEEMLHQALENLVSNAIKYSPEGGTVTLGSRNEEECVTLWVKDEGLGIPPEAIDQIFDRVFRIDIKNGRRVGGSGLGLPLVKEIAKLHNGRVWVESLLGKGSTFYMSLPLGEGESQED